MHQTKTHGILQPDFIREFQIHLQIKSLIKCLHNLWHHKDDLSKKYAKTFTLRIQCSEKFSVQPRSSKRERKL